MCTRYWVLGSGRQGGWAPKPKGLTPYPAVQGVGQLTGSGGLLRQWRLRGPQRRVPEALTSSPTLGARCKKCGGKKEPPLWTIVQGLLLGGPSRAKLPGAGKQGSQGGSAKQRESAGESAGGKGSLRSL